MMAPAGAKQLQRTLAAIRRTVRSRELWQPGDRLLMACSGGLDSVTGTALLAEMRPALGHELLVAHIDHGLRPDVPLDREVVAALAERFELRLLTADLALETGPDLQSRARQARYRALHTLAADGHCSHIVTAHHADDQAETLLLRMARGCGPEALAGIRGHRQDRVVRPFLGEARSDLRACAEQLALHWRDDPSNRDYAYSRNRLRHEVMSALNDALPGAARGMARTAENISNWQQASSWWVDRALESHMEIGSETGGERWVQLPDKIVPRQLGPLSALLGRVVDHLGLDHPGQRAAEQLLTVLRTRKVAGTTCELHGMTVFLTDHEVRFESGFVARPRGADYPAEEGSDGAEIPAPRGPIERDPRPPNGAGIEAG